MTFAITALFVFVAAYRMPLYPLFACAVVGAALTAEFASRFSGAPRTRRRWRGVGNLAVIVAALIAFISIGG